MKYHSILGVVVLTSALAFAQKRDPLFVAPVYIEYSTASAEQFAAEVKALKDRVGNGPDVMVGFATYLDMRFQDPLLAEPINRSVMQPSLDAIDLIMARARSSSMPVHISIASGFFHGWTQLREAAIRDDVRNAQWFSDGRVADPEERTRTGEIPRSAWLTPSRSAQPLRKRMEESVRILGESLAAAMQKYPEALHSVSGDTEVELSFARNLNLEGGRREGGQIVLADYSPFMVEEFRDWLRQNRYKGDRTPAADDDRDGHTLNGDFRQQFLTWDLRYFNESGPIPYNQYVAMNEKLPRTGKYFIDGGFDAPRSAGDNAFWQTWKEFRVRVVSNYLRDFAQWVTLNSRIPPSRYYTHQIPAEYLFGGKDTTRLETSASPLETAFIRPLGSAGVTIFDLFNGKTFSKTASADLFQRLQQSGTNWGILEYSPAVPATMDEDHYLQELRTVASFKPSIIAPFAWTNAEEHKQYRIQNTAYERALKRFVQENLR